MEKLEDLIALLGQNDKVPSECLIEYCQGSSARVETVAHALARGKIKYQLLPYVGQDTPALRKSADQYTELHYISLIEDGDYAEKVQAFRELLKWEGMCRDVLGDIDSASFRAWLKVSGHSVKEADFPPELAIAVQCYRDLYGDGVPSDMMRKAERVKIEKWLDARYIFTSTDQKNRIATIVNPVQTDRIPPPVRR